MPLPVIADTYRVSLLWDHADFPGNAVNVMHFRKTGGTASDLAAKFDSHVTNTMWNLEDSHAAIYEVDVTPLDGSTATYSFFTGSPSKWKGFSSTHDVVPQMAGVLKLVTAKRGRSYRGRVFLPWVSEVYNTNGQLDATTCANTGTAWGTFIGAMGGDGWDMVVASYLLETAEDVIGVSCETDSGTQRRRNPR